jgi:hypothetical protein
VICNPATQRIGEGMRDMAQDAAPTVLAVIASGLPCGRAARADRRCDGGGRRPARPSSRSPTPPRAGGHRGRRPDRDPPGVTEEMLARVMSATWTAQNKGPRDRRAAHRRGGGANHLPERPDLRLGSRAQGVPDAGELTAPGAFGNLPCGEGFIAPVRGPPRGGW